MGWVILLWQLRRSKNPVITGSIFLLSFICFAGLATGVPGISLFSQILRAIPFLSQAFRIPFTKLSMSMTLFLSLCSGVAIYTLFQRGKYVAKRFALPLKVGVTGLFCCALIYYSWPSFGGNFLYKGARNTFPTEYRQLFAYLQSQPSHQRIANFPILTDTGWEMFRWNDQAGYTGSGFYWYALPQPILNRAFDVWHPNNENYRLQMVHAVYNNDPQEFETLLKKYDVAHVLIDESVIIADNPKAPLLNQKLATLLSRVPNVQFETQIGFLKLYAFTPNLEKSAVYSPPNYKTVGTQPNGIREDKAAQFLGNVVGGTGYHFPFAFLAQESIPAAQLEQQDDQFSIHTQTQFSDETSSAFVLPDFIPGQNIDFTLQLQKKDRQLLLTFIPSLPNFSVNEKNIQLAQTQTLSFKEPAKLPEKFLVQINDQVLAVDQKELSLATPQTIGQISLGYQEPITVDFFKQLTTSVARLDTATFDSSFWQNYQNFHVPINPTKTINATAQFTAQPISIDVTKPGFYLPFNCDYEKDGSIQRTINEGSVTFRTQNGGSICEYYLLPNLPLNQGYLIHVQGRNTAGKSPRVIITNGATTHNDLEYQLSSGNFSDYLVFLPSKYEERGLSINLTTRSYGLEKAENTIEKIEAIPIPIETILGSFIQSKDAQETKNKATITDVKSTGTGLYSVQVSNPSAGGLIVLSESFDNNWIAFKKPQNIREWLQLSHRLLEHREYNDWANAWVVPEGTYSVFIWYWPQLLTFVGYGLLVLGLLVVSISVLLSFRKKSKKKLPISLKDSLRGRNLK
jgi:hypothetical protein